VVFHWVGLGVLVTGLCAGIATAQSADSDHDGLSDAFEQQLLLRFAPAFLVSVGECDSLPAEFQPGAAEPRALAKNGTIYVHVFPVRPQGIPSAPAGAAFIEIHYHHLWSTDCGRMGHPLDAEHVSVLVRADAPGRAPAEWKAVYWYAAAHEDTACDAGNGAKAESLRATDQGPLVWISLGKHASYLSPETCKRGCGGDQCGKMTRMVPAGFVNLGERGAPMNGAVWVESPSWSMAGKLAPDFTEHVIAQLEQSNAKGVISVSTSPAAVKAVILAGDSTADGLATGNKHTEAALNTAEGHTDRAVSKSYEKVDGSLRKSHRAVKNFFRRVFK
jgi:hypothetical protein